MIDLVNRRVGSIEEKSPNIIITSSHLNIFESKDTVPVVSSNRGVLEDGRNNVETCLGHYSAMCEYWVEMLHKVPHFV